MKSTLKTKLLQHFITKKEEGGFTLIELLVVIIIIGILAAIALPSFLNQANKARQSEAKTYVGSMNRAQQAYYLERSEFTPDLGQLGLGIKPLTQFYSYEIELDTTDPAGVNAARPWDVDNDVYDADSSLKGYVGGFGIGNVQATNEATTLAVLCETVDTPVQADGALDTVAPYSFANSITYDATTGPECAGEFQTIE
ncbi:hypothetical protein C7271_00835 [filamentous cyanobacterium CCP5]|nr:hypothetical protein C7271_00835 [filamentous cyanobacterium CCP5]